MRQNQLSAIASRSTTMKTATAALLALCCAATQRSEASTPEKRATEPQPRITLPPGVKAAEFGTFIPGTATAYKFLFDNGLRVLLLPDNRNPIATLRIRLDAGSNREVKGETGLAHFFEHMMFRKTAGSDEGEYDRTLSGLGGNGNAATSTDMVMYYSTFPAPGLETMLNLEAKRFQNLDLTDPYFTTEKGAVIAERGLNYDNNPRNRAREVLTSLVERGTPYEWMTIGAKSDVQNMKIETVRKFYATYYVPNNTILTLGGAIQINEALALVHKYFGNWKRGEVSPHPRPMENYLTRHKGKEFICSEDVADQNYILTYPSLRNSFRDQVYAAAFEIALNDHPEGPLEHRMIKNRFATGIGVAKRVWQNVAQPMDIYFSLAKGQQFAPARTYWQNAVAELLKRPVDERFRKRVIKNFTVNDAEHSLKMTTLAEDYEDYESRFGDFLIGAQEKRIVHEMKTSDFHKWIKENLNQSEAYLTGVTPSGIATSCAQLAQSAAK